MNEAIMLVDLKEKVDNCEYFNYDKVASAALLSASAGMLQKYDTEKTYNKGDKIVYITDDGELLILVCMQYNVTGRFTPAFWEIWNIMDELEGLYDDYVVSSWERPYLRRNKVWLEIKDESIEDAEAVGWENELMVAHNNLVISERQPLLNRQTIWGMITEKL